MFTVLSSIVLLTLLPPLLPNWRLPAVAEPETTSGVE